MAWEKYPYPFSEKVEKLWVKKPRRTVTKYKVEPKKDWTKGRMPSQNSTKKYETFDEYARNLGVSFPSAVERMIEPKPFKLTPTQTEYLKKSRKSRPKGKITTHGVDRVRVAKQGPKPKRMLRVDCEGKT